MFFSKNKYLESIILILWLVIAGMLYFNINKSQQLIVDKEISQESNLAGNTYKIKKISIIESNSFDITFLDENRKNVRILARIAASPTSEAREAILKLLNNIKQPEIVILDKNQVNYLVEIYFNISEKKSSLTEWLSEQNFLYD
jgi:hypothetical protein